MRIPFAHGTIFRAQVTPAPFLSVTLQSDTLIDSRHLARVLSHQETVAHVSARLRLLNARENGRTLAGVGTGEGEGGAIGTGRSWCVEASPCFEVVWSQVSLRTVVHVSIVCARRPHPTVVVVLRARRAPRSWFTVARRLVLGSETTSLRPSGVGSWRAPRVGTDDVTDK